ncbi:MAG TPA: c-type cytochrome [Streptosporangiaceae bacterium]|nr:c-type cytochrome [Streptosporangiaceae bacterium]
MSWIKPRRRHPAAGYAVLLLGLVIIGVVYAAIAGGGSAASAATPGGPSAHDIAVGQALFARTCSSCHGMNAQGTSAAPSLVGVGAAAVDFQVSTGRMPGKDFGAEMPRKPVTFTQQQIHQLAAYIASLGGGPTIPSAAQVSPAGADMALGQQLFITDCAQCHNFAGAGGALTYGKSAPALTQSTPTQIYEAMLTGPEAMPVFSDTTITPSQKRDIIAYVTTTRAEPNPGGFSLGRVGPVTEGLVTFLGGIAILVFAAMWLTMKRREA